MTLTSLSFLIFLAVVVLLYYVVPKRFQWCLLLLASYAFYLFSGIAQVAFIIATTLISYGAGLIMQKMRDEFRDQKDLTKEERREAKKAVKKRIHRVQVIAVLLDLGILAVVKYLNFLTQNLNGLFALFRFDAQIPYINIIVPLGISFYTFMSMGYLISVGRGKFDAERHLGKFALFVSFFPTIIQGPIGRYDDVGQQLQQEHPFQYENIAYGAQLILWGFFKKLVIADRISVISATVFAGDDASLYSGSVYFFGMLVYAVQIYCDFSGGIDISRGAAQMLGIDLPQNFQRPYFSTSVADYWRRWHITLGNWMRDYVFYAVMLSKPITKLSKFCRQRIGPHVGKIVPSAITSFVVFFLIGVWHGANWRYVAFGLYNAVIVSASVALDPFFQWTNAKLRINTESFSWRVFRIVRTFLLTGFAKVIARAARFKAAAAILKKIFTDVDLAFVFGVDGQMLKLGLDGKNFTVALVAICILFVVSVLQERGVEMRRTIARQNVLFRWAVWIALFAVVLIFGIYGPEYDAVSFIYQGF